jgi:hypothetical protein
MRSVEGKRLFKSFVKTPIARVRLKRNKTNIEITVINLMKSYRRCSALKNVNFLNESPSFYLPSLTTNELSFIKMSSTMEFDRLLFILRRY